MADTYRYRAILIFPYDYEQLMYTYEQEWRLDVISVFAWMSVHACHMQESAYSSTVPSSNKHSSSALPSRYHYTQT